MNDDVDDLDRALFALPLAEAPAGLRAAILNATVYAAQAPQLALDVWELAAIGAALATVVWLAILFLVDRAFAASVNADVTFVVQGLSNPGILAWYGAGVCVALAVSLFGSDALRLPMRRRG